MTKRVGPRTVWCVVDGMGAGVYSVHRNRARALDHCYFFGAHPVQYALVVEKKTKPLRPRPR